MIPYVVKVCVAFAVGGVIGVLGVWSPQFMGVYGIWALGLLMISYAIGGAIGGASLGRGRRPAIGFGLGFVFSGFIVPLTMVSFQGQSGSQKDWLIVIIAWFLMYAIGGGIGAAVGGLGWRVALASTAAFGGAGAIAGAAIMSSFYIFTGAPMAFYVAPVIPHALGGALLAVALEYPSHKRKKLGLCVNCAYDLRGSSERCPECGEAIDPEILSARSSPQSD